MAPPTTKSALFTPLTVGTNQLSNRLVMAPLTRFRASDTHVPLPFVKEYYAQRACVPGTLLITEATPVSLAAGGYANVPGIFTQEQIAAWKEVVDAVHAKGSFLWLQLWATGRAASQEVMKQEGTGDVVSASDIPMAKDATVPRALTESEIEAYVKDFATAAKNAVEGAGFDGVEIHGANGYLIDQFTQDVSNKRTDSWGGSVEKRSRFALEITKAIVEAVGAEKTAIRLSPFSTFQGMKMEDPVPQFNHLISGLKEQKIAYLHLVESRISGSAESESTEKIDPFVDLWGKTSPVFIAGGFTADTAKRAVDEEYKDKDVCVVFGRYFISTPDLVFRIEKGIELTKYDRSTFYKAKSQDGYTDYDFSKEFKEAKL